MQKRFSLFAVGITAALLLSSCFDKEYDLSDIDTTTQIRVDNLMLPVNLDPVVLSDIIKIDPDDKIQPITVNGKTFYAVQQSGSFESNPIEIPSFRANIDPLSPTDTYMNLTEPAYTKTLSEAPAGSVTYRLSEPVVKNLDYTAADIDKSIISVKEMNYTDFRFGVTLDISGLPTGTQSTLHNVQMLFPKGVTIKSVNGGNNHYEENDEGLLITFNDIPVNANRANIEIISTGLSLEANGVDIDNNTHSLSFNSHYIIKHAELELSSSAPASTLPDKVDLHIEYNLGSNSGSNVKSFFDVTDITGTINYLIEGSGLNIDPVTLNDLPDFLAQQGTNLILANPQIYLSINNPLGAEKMYYGTDFLICAVRGSDKRDFPFYNFTVGKKDTYTHPTYGLPGPFNFVLSPETPTDIPAEYATDINPLVYNNLDMVLSGEGLPDKINIELVDPQIPTQDVERFALDRKLDAVKGSYNFLAPLALKNVDGLKSVIIYTDREDGWNDEDVDAIAIEHVSLTAVATSSLPLSAELSAYPIDKYGNRINATVVPATIEARAAGQSILIEISGDIRHLDGVEYQAVVHADNSQEALSPDMNITLENIRATVSGNYTKKL